MSYILIKTDDGLELRDSADKRSKPLRVDFLTGKMAHRRRYGGGRGQLLAKAVGVKPGVTLKVLDATAGLGVDAFILATLGCRLMLIERSPTIARLLADGLKRAQCDPACADLELNLIVTDAVTYMRQLTTQQRPDVVYLDPMFPDRSKSALVKKEMRILRDIVGPDNDVTELLQAALAIARKRVVVKRPKLAPSLPGPQPDLIFKGKSSRFDVYLLH